jgi:hypothetical protein
VAALLEDLAVPLSLTGNKDSSNTDPDSAPLATVRLWDGSTHWLVTGQAERDALLGGDVTHPGQLGPGGGPQERGAAFRGLIAVGEAERGRLRQVVIPPVATVWVKAMRPAVECLVDGQADELAAGAGPADLVEGFARPVSSQAVCQLLGVPQQDRAFLRRSSQVLTDAGVPLARAQAALPVLENYLANLVASKISTPGSDLLSRLAADWVLTDRLAQQDLATLGVMLLVAGHETSADVIALGVLSQLRHRGRLAALRDAGDQRLFDEAVTETLRHLALVHAGCHLVARADIQLGGMLIHAGESLILPASHASGAEPVLAEAGCGAVDGDTRRCAMFGFGVHQRLGQALARVELRASYRALARHIPSMALATSQADIPFKRDGLPYGLDELSVTW